MAASIIRTANPAGVAASGNIATYSSVDIGTADASRIVVVLVGTELSASTPSACTIDYGSGDTAMTAGTGGNQGISYSQLYYLAVPTGTTATIKVTYSATNPGTTANHIAVYKVTGAKVSTTGGDNSTDMDSTDPLTTGSITIASGGAFLAIASCGADTQTKTWANATEDLDDDVGTFRFCTAYRTTALTTTAVTCTGTGNGEDGGLSYIIFTENTAPTVSLSSPTDAGTITDTTPDLVFTGTDADSNDVRYQVHVDTDNTFPQTSGNCLDFDGTDDYARRANASTANNNFTAAMWVKIDAYGGGTTVFFNNGVTDARGYTLRITSAGVLEADYSFVAGLSSGYTLSTGTWYHVVLRRALGISQIFVNSTVQGGQFTSTPNAAGSGDYITLGASTTSTPTTSSFCNCKLDDVRLYERALSNDEIDTLYANGNVYSSTDISTTSLKAHWKLDETSGTNVDDATATAWDLTTSGSPTWTTGIVPTASSVDVDKLSGTDAGFSGSPDNSDPFTSAQAVTYTVQSALSNVTTYYWRVRGKDPNNSNTWGAWSSTRSFYIDTGGGGGTAVKDIIGMGFIPFAR